VTLRARVSRLEISCHKETMPLCIFIVALAANEEGQARPVIAYSAGDRSWSRFEGEGDGQFKARVAAEVEATGRATLVCARYEEEAA